MKKAFLFLLFLFVYTNTKAEIISGSDCGATESDQCNWSIDTQTGVLTISGNGNMKSYGDIRAYGGRTDVQDFLDERPWNNYSSAITSIVVEKGISSIGTRAFEFMNNVQNVTIGDGVQGIGYYSLYNMNKLNTIVIPESANLISTSWLGNTPQLQTLYCPETMITQCRQKASNAEIIPYSKTYNGQYVSNGKRYASLSDIGSGKEYHPKRIYTVDEAASVTKSKNTFSIRYR